MLDPIDFSIIKFTDCVSDELMQKIEASGEVSEFKKGTIIERRGDRSTHISLIKSGLIRLGLSEADGSNFNMSILGSGSTFGDTALTLDLPVQFDAYCETDAILVRLSRETVEQLSCTNLGFLRALNKIANERVHAMLQYIGASIKAPLEVRVANFLVMMCNETSDSETLHCRQNDLAHALGVSRVSMGKSLKSLEQKNLIVLGYGKIEIPSLLKLQSSIASVN